MRSTRSLASKTNMERLKGAGNEQRSKQQRGNREKSEEALGREGEAKRLSEGRARAKRLSEGRARRRGSRKGGRGRAFGDGLHDGGERAAATAGRAQLDAVCLRQDHDSLMDLLPPLDLQ